jgi:hypothetical protein
VFPSGYLGVQGVQPLLPQGPVPAQPVIDLGERLGTKTVDPPLRLLADLDQPCLPQHPQVRDTPGRAIGSSAASSPAVAGPLVKVSSIVRRLSSASARNTASMA